MRVVHCKREKHDVYIGRPSKWGNPFVIGPGIDKEAEQHRAAVIAQYEAWLIKQPHLMASLHELRGKVLGCWCAPKSCHGDVLVRLANTPSPGDAEQGEATAPGHDSTSGRTAGEGE